MTPAISLFLGLTVTLAAAVVLYVANLRFISAARLSSSVSRWAFVPVATPVIAWRLGARTLPISFGVVSILYLLLWVSVRVGGG
jgi:hypothetical protein